nr:carbon-nitrogen hydrolase family protein [Quadrisphaera sp. INWT6]
MLTVAAVSAGFTRDLDACFAQVERLVDDARERGAGLLALPEAAVGGYLSALGSHGDVADPTRPARSQPPALRLDGPEVARLRAIAGDLVLCVGLCELAGADDARDDEGARYNTAVCLTGDAVLGAYRKVHQPSGSTWPTPRAAASAPSRRRSGGSGCRSATTRPSPRRPARWRSTAPSWW